MQVEVFLAKDAIAAEWVLEFEAVPRIGEYLSLEAGGYFSYYNVIEVWYRQDGSGPMRACLQVELDD